ncbi:MAG: aminodeoxychorismate/anthranilate synthase component II [Victivallales bacterium]|nr:aminodeoxychorismate/anthranilate synthase component II [Victivallales bacterium]MCF7888836.1 aminodeoxychorismate/anthranilate synthase component II [Victivallales bacterium]
MILMIDNYDSFTYNIVQYFRELNQDVNVIRNNAVSADFIMENEKFDKVVISPGPCTPKQAGISCSLIEKLADKELPVLGVCLGFQSIGDVFGANIVHAPELMHGKTSKIYHNNEGIFDDIPSPYSATRYHSLIISPSSIPDCLKVTAKTIDGIVMGIQHKNLPIYGVQFHPESILTEFGHKLLRNFIKIQN